MTVDNLVINNSYLRVAGIAHRSSLFIVSLFSHKQNIIVNQAYRNGGGMRYSTGNGLLP